ncbi:MAG: hypothetical protein PGN13_07995 [Patulibacter minatonensis]
MPSPSHRPIRLRLLVAVALLLLGCASASPASAATLALADSTGCAIGDDALVRCWGENEYGQVTGVDRVDRAAATVVPGLPPARAVANNPYASCAVIVDGTVQCWGGANWSERAGEPQPKTILGVADAVDIAAGDQELCVIRRDRTISCVAHVRFGRGTTFEPVPSLGTVRQLAMHDEHRCVLTQARRVSCWGILDNVVQRGAHYSRAVRFATLDGARNIGITQEGKVCGVFADGTMRCVPPKVPRGRKPGAVPPAAVRIRGLRDATVAVSGGTLCAVRRTARVWCDDLPVDYRASPGPDDIAGLEGATSAVASGWNGCAETRSGLRCWGPNVRALGSGQPATVSTPQTVPGLDDAVGISSEGRAVCVLHATGRVSCWGPDSSRWPGIGERAAVVPTPIRGIGGATRIAATCVSGSAASACWGPLGSRTLGVKPRPLVATLDTPSIPGCSVIATRVECLVRSRSYEHPTITRLDAAQLGPARAVAVAPSLGDICAIVLDGSVRCTRGDEVTTIAGAHDLTAIAAQDNAFCGTGPGGRVQCWRGSDYGDKGGIMPPGPAEEMLVTGGETDQIETRCFPLGHGDLGCRAGARTLVRRGLSGVVAYAAPCALLSNRTVSCWGDGELLGDGRAPAGHSGSVRPVAVAGL